MTNDAGARPAKGSRQERLKLALRENLKRRKAQARRREDGDAAEQASASADDARDSGRARAPDAMNTDDTTR